MDPNTQLTTVSAVPYSLVAFMSLLLFMSIALVLKIKKDEKNNMTKEKIKIFNRKVEDLAFLKLIAIIVSAIILMKYHEASGNTHPDTAIILVSLVIFVPALIVDSYIFVYFQKKQSKEK